MCFASLVGRFEERLGYSEEKAFDNAASVFVWLGFALAALVLALVTFPYPWRDCREEMVLLPGDYVVRELDDEVEGKELGKVLNEALLLTEDQFLKLTEGEKVELVMGKAALHYLWGVRGVFFKHTVALDLGFLKAFHTVNSWSLEGDEVALVLRQPLRTTLLIYAVGLPIFLSCCLFLISLAFWRDVERAVDGNVFKFRLYAFGRRKERRL